MSTSVVLRNQDLPTAAVMARNISRHYGRATREQLATGRAWYAQAGERVLGEMVHLSRGKLTRDGAARIVAALSPRMPWGRNVALALDVAARVGAGLDPTPPGVMRQAAVKVDGVARGETVKLGPKQTAFAANLQGDYEPVTVDVWAIRAATGRDKVDGIAPNAYSTVADAYRRAASKLGETPAELQAVVWCVIRGTGE